MGDNFISYNRFTAHPANISDYVPSLAGLTASAGKPDPNPVVSPMPRTKVSEAKLAFAAGGSDKLRVGYSGAA